MSESMRCHEWKGAVVMSDELDVIGVATSTDKPLWMAFARDQQSVFEAEV